jgi:hypothetical protein
MKFRWKRRDGQNGSYSFVPVVTQEDSDFNPESRSGLIVGLGWQPEQFDDMTQRARIENSTDYQEYVGYVTTNPELQNATTKGPNIYDQQRFNVRKFAITKAHTTSLKWQWQAA